LLNNFIFLIFVKIKSMKKIGINKTNPEFEKVVNEEKKAAKKRFEGYFKTLKNLKNDEGTIRRKSN
jgi:hypothetical protein